MCLRNIFYLYSTMVIFSSLSLLSEQPSTYHSDKMPRGKKISISDYNVTNPNQMQGDEAATYNSVLNEMLISTDDEGESSGEDALSIVLEQYKEQESTAEQSKSTKTKCSSNESTYEPIIEHLTPESVSLLAGLNYLRTQAQSIIEPTDHYAQPKRGSEVGFLPSLLPTAKNIPSIGISIASKPNPKSNSTPCANDVESPLKAGVSHALPTDDNILVGSGANHLDSVLPGEKGRMHPITNRGDDNPINAVIASVLSEKADITQSAMVSTALEGSPPSSQIDQESLEVDTTKKDRPVKKTAIPKTQTKVKPKLPKSTNTFHNRLDTITPQTCSSNTTPNISRSVPSAIDIVRKTNSKQIYRQKQGITTARNKSNKTKNGVHNNKRSFQNQESDRDDIDNGPPFPKRQKWRSRNDTEEEFMDEQSIDSDGVNDEQGRSSKGGGRLCADKTITKKIHAVVYARVLGRFVVTEGHHF